MTVAFSAAHPEDAETLAAILRGWILQTPWMPKLHTADEDRGFLSHLIATQSVTMARLDGQTAGFMAREGHEINALYLAPFARRRGIGAQFLTQAKAATPHLALWTFQANADARRFYGAQGFAQDLLTDGQANDEKLPDVRLVWKGTAP